MEIIDVIKSIPKEKSPEVDEFHIEFFTKNWEIMKDKIVYAVQQLFYTGTLSYDLLMYCRADLISVKLLNEAFMRFSKALGLQANLEKSSLYIAGVADHTKEELLKEIGYVVGVLPFKYLGVPLASKKLSVNQFLPMIEKITAKVAIDQVSFVWGTSLLVLDFLIPKKVIKSIEQICRTFLWTRSVTVSKKALVSWETVCKPHAVGGLNIMDLCLWNRAAILKQLWNIARSKECLWI
ncbi:uncharacterized protein LOC125857904 [Solanum stenotomum]|uniref:uncharacterized protein LOC125857904 n=1 Tax=Solanum stenotomum TaxID=172797 RepID=UPI0020D17EB6|nr:uncharacterized protein LOC125857904 [Solanum stenotomum]